MVQALDKKGGPMSIKVLRGALDETANGDIVLRGVIAPESLRVLEVDDYQREVLPLASINKLAKAYRNGGVPDIELGMRGQHVIERDELFYLQDQTYIIDGLQRVNAAMRLVDQGEPDVANVGAKVHFGTTPEWEREQFRLLNMERLKLSPNVLLRNWRYDFKAAALLYSLAQNPAFVLQHRVSWNQRMLRKELITATTFAKIVARLHSHLGPGKSSRVDQVVKGLENVYDVLGKQAMQANIMTFFNVIDSAYGVKRVQFKQGATYMTGTFLMCLARVLSNHTDFWRGDDEKTLFVEASLIRKISQFPYSDPQVIQLASSGGKAPDILYMLMVNHINSGKRTRRLKPRNLDYVDLNDGQNGEEG
jgi:hypothetical protein